MSSSRLRHTSSLLSNFTVFPLVVSVAHRRRRLVARHTVVYREDSAEVCIPTGSSLAQSRGWQVEGVTWGKARGGLRAIPEMNTQNTAERRRGSLVRAIVRMCEAVVREHAGSTAKRRRETTTPRPFRMPVQSTHREWVACSFIADYVCITGRAAGYVVSCFSRENKEKKKVRWRSWTARPKCRALSYK